MKKDYMKPEGKVVAMSVRENIATSEGSAFDDVKVHYNGKTYSADVTVAIDKEGGDFGGFLALMPYSAVSNAFR